MLQPLDREQVTARIRTNDVVIATWLFPVVTLQNMRVHKRYEVEATHESVGENGTAAPPSGSSGDENGSPKFGMVTLLVGNNTPFHQTRLEKWLDPAPHATLSLRVSVMDRIHWQRSAWLAGSVCQSLCWGRIPKTIFNIPLDYKNKVEIDAVFDKSAQIYTKYQVDVPGYGFSLSLRDTGIPLLSGETPITEGFLDNESALRQLGLQREVNMNGVGNAVYRQPLWSSPSHPNVAEVLDLKCGSLFEYYLGCAEPVSTKPVACWLVDEVEETLIYQMEAQVEDENDPNSATTFGERSLVERVQKKAMNRYTDFRDEIRTKTYSDLEGRELPR